MLAHLLYFLRLPSFRGELGGPGISTERNTLLFSLLLDSWSAVCASVDFVFRAKFDVILDICYFSRPVGLDFILDILHNVPMLLFCDYGLGGVLVCTNYVSKPNYLT